jgi:hypothetical protein
MRRFTTASLLTIRNGQCTFCLTQSDTAHRQRKSRHSGGGRGWGRGWMRLAEGGVMRLWVQWCLAGIEGSALKFHPACLPAALAQHSHRT